MTLRACKPKPCRACGVEFLPRVSSAQVVCSPICASAYAKAKAGQKIKAEKRKRDRAARAELRKRKEALKSRSDYLKEAQRAFNRFIRVRDYGKPCISSGQPLAWEDNSLGGRIDAGHYRSIGAAPHLRFNVYNCHAQSVRENRDRAGNATDYRLGLIERIGLERVERLEQDHTTRKFSVFYLKRVKAIFTRRARLYERLREGRQ